MKIDEQTIKSVLDRYGDMLYFLAKHYVRDNADAEDIVQDVLLSLIKNQNSVAEGDVKAWLIRVTVNRSLDFIKKHKRIVRFDCSETAATTEKYDCDLFDVLQRLSKKDREMVFLYYYAGYSSKEIAEMCNRSDAAVRKSLQRARNKLEIFLKDGI